MSKKLPSPKSIKQLQNKSEEKSENILEETTEIKVRNKATNMEIFNRVQESIGLLMKGMGRQEILQHTSEKWGVCERAAEEIVNRAKKILIEKSRNSLDEDIAIVMANWWKMFNEAREDGDRQYSSVALKEISKLKGLEQITINHTFTKNEEIKDIDDDFIEAEVVKKNVS